MLSSHELRKKYLEFFQSKGHKIIPSASLIPENDPTVLFNTAGMQPLVPYLLGQKHPEGARITDVQKCIRTVDIDEVGDNSHLTFFEMLGNWSLGDYFKKEAIEWSWEFLTSLQWLGLDKRKLSATVFGGDKRFSSIPKDDESAKIWRDVGLPVDKIVFMPGGVLESEDNWWGPAGLTGPCGSSSEMFFWQGSSEFPPVGSNPGTDKDNWLEIWNDVFMQYNKKDEKTFELLDKKNVDTGMGMDRTICVLNGFADIYRIDTLWPLLQKIEEISGRKYAETVETTISMRIIADHLRAAAMIMGDERGIAPGNVDQGYIVRRLIRRSVRHGRLLGINENFCGVIAKEVINIFREVYQEVGKNRDFILAEMEKEESKFRDTLERGEKEANGNLDGKKAFDLFQSYGFPVEMTLELARERGQNVDNVGFMSDFNEEMKKHQELSRAGAEQKFKSGLADNSEMSTKYHTATHLLLASLRKILGGTITQKGSNITAERLRFDFNWNFKLSAEQLQQVEDLVNQKIKDGINVEMMELPKEEAKKMVTVLSFDLDKYGDRVKVYKIGDFSAEFCGGPHVTNTNVLGHFKIIKEEASSAGVRRIKAILE